MARVCVITAGHLSTCPRMFKAAVSLREAGHQVRVVSANYEPWATTADSGLGAQIADWKIIDYSRASGNWLRIRSGIRWRMARAVAGRFGPSRLPPAVLGRAINRMLPELISAICAQPADFLYGGGFALAATAFSAKRLRIPYGIDLEDFHSGEHADTPEGKLSDALAEAAERMVFHDAALLTAASDSIANAYQENYGRLPLVINNTFPLPARAPDFAPRNGAPLQLYWFSQSIGPDRGLEELVRAAGAAGIQCELHLRCKNAPAYLADLRTLANTAAPALQIIHHPPAPPGEMIELCRGYHVGLALEPGGSRNNSLALSNKAFTYILAGLAVAFTDTPGQQGLANDLGEGALLCRPGDVAALASGLKTWAADDARLQQARRAAWSAACRRWHWNHHQEEGQLLAAVDDVLMRRLQ